MKRDTGIVAGLAAVLMLVGITGRQKSPENPSATSSGARAYSGKSAFAARRTNESGKLAPYKPCEEIVQQLQRFVTNPEGASLDSLPTSRRLPDSCYEHGTLLTKLKPLQTSGVKFAIATVPDPVSTHLPLMFDRMVESIQQAAQDEGYTYDGSWFPWDTTTKDYVYLDDQLEAERLHDIQQAQPGVMVFRQGADKSGDDSPYKHGLVVFVVGEQPTGGLRDDQFDNALAWLLQLSGKAHPEVAAASQKEAPSAKLSTSSGNTGPQDPLLILGPAFSGSLPSLKLALQRNLGEPCTTSVAKKETPAPLCAYVGQNLVKVSSGTVSSERSYMAFRDWINSSTNGSFITAMESDSLSTSRFCQYLEAQKYEAKYVAELSEDETAFGNIASSPLESKSGLQADSEPCPALSLYYPRDIATVRSAYEQESIFSSGKGDSNSQTPASRLRGDLSEASRSDNDSVRHYGGSLIPIQQESILAEISHRLSENRIQFIILRSTNSLDEIFLSEFLRRAYPEGRVVMDGADLLFTEGSWGGLLRGVMVLSPYPLLTQEAQWTSSLLTRRSGAYRTFGADTSEGVYIAARGLFADPGAKENVPLHDYSPPAWLRHSGVSKIDDEVPSTWIAVVGHRRFWSVAALNQQVQVRSSILQTAKERGDGDPIDDGDARVPEFPTVMWALLIVTAIWAGIHFWLCALPSLVHGPRARANFEPLRCWEHPTLLALSGFMLATLAVIVVADSGLFGMGTGTVSYHWAPTAVLLKLWLWVVVLASFSGLALNYRRLTLTAGVQSVARYRTPQLLAFGGAALLCVVVLSVYLHLIQGLSAANAVPAYWRAVNLLSGVSPLLPQLLMIAAMYAWFWCRLRGLAHLGDDRPRLPSQKDLPMMPAAAGAAPTPMMPMFGRELGANPVEEATRPLGWRYLAMLGVGFIMAMAGCWVALEDTTVRTLGERPFGTFMFWWLCLSIAMILGSAGQLSYVWSKLRRLLIHLDRLPLRRTLRALKGIEWGSIWKVSGNVLEERYRVITLQVESLRHLKNTLTLSAARDADELERTGAVLATIDDCLGHGLRDLAKWYVEFQQTGKPSSLNAAEAFQEQLAAIAGSVMVNILISEWHLETESSIFRRPAPDDKTPDDKAKEDAAPTASLPAHVRAAEEFFVLPYVAFIQNTLGQMRSIVLGTLWVFVGATLAFASYPFQPLNVLGAIFLTVFVLVGVPTVVVYAQMCRDATLSHIADTKPGELGGEFWFRLAGFGIGPLLGLLSTLFPSISDFVFSWFQPGVESLK